MVLDGQAVFELDGEQVSVEAGEAIAVTDPSVRRSAKALTADTNLMVIGAGDAPFASTWNPSHFKESPRPH